MTRGTIMRIAILFGFLIGVTSSLLALNFSNDLVFIIAERFFLVFVVSVGVAWSALFIINSTIVGAARASVAKLTEEEHDAKPNKEAEGVSLAELFTRAHEDATTKGQNLDFTSAPTEDVLGLGTTQASDENPEIKEFEPFKPKKIETDKESNG